MPNRIIKESIKLSTEIDALSWFEEVVFYRLIVTADDYGRLDGRVIVLRNELFPTKENITRKSVEEALNKLVSVGLLIPYVDAESNMPYYYLPSWQEHQRVRDSKAKYPAPPDNSPQLAATRRGLPQLAADCGLESESKIESESKTNNAPARESETIGFDDFWAVYPRKVAKNNAIKAWNAGKFNKIAEIIIADVRKRVDTEWKGQDLQYIPHPTTYLHQRRWEDETPPQTRDSKAPAPRNYTEHGYTDDDYGEDFFINLAGGTK